MKRLLVVLIVLFSIAACSTANETKKSESAAAKKVEKKWNYPETERKLVKDTYFGIEVEDNYRWLEENDKEPVQNWTKAQNEFTEKTVFGWDQPGKIEKRLAEVWNYDKMMTPEKRGDKLFFRLLTGLQNQPALYVQTGDEKKVLVDPNTLSKEGTTAMDWWYVSPNGKYIAYGLSENGSEQSSLYILDVESGEHVDKPIDGCRYASVGWLPDDSGFFYSRKLDGKNPEEIDMEQTIRFHKLGTESSEDPVIAKSSIKEAIIVSTIGDKGKWLLISEYKGSSGKAKLLLYNVETKETKTVVDNYDNIYDGLIFDGYIYLKTDKDNALSWKIDRVNCETLEWENVVPAHEKDVIDYFAVSNGKLLITYMHDVAGKVVLVDIDSKESKEIKLPVLGTVMGLSANAETDEIFLSFSSFAYPPAVLKYTDSEGLAVFWQAEVPAKVDDIVTEQVFYKSKDGTDVPMFIVYKKGLKKDGKSHCMLKGYGGFNVTYPMYFSSSNLVWLETGGVLAIANIRGGGEYGEKWHRAGMLDKKQNTFDDFAWAMKYLAQKGYTSKEKLAIWGGSNGGLLTGAMLTQYPELFQAALVAVPLLDMLRFHKFLIGRYWVSEYGSSDNEEQFKYILKYSPYQNIKKGGKFPAAMLTAGEHDSRVHPLHAKKMAAALQYENTSDNPIFLWVETKAGHGQGKSTQARIRETAMELGFFLKMLDVKEW